jgi:basic amino acid/polyamine antiporter, APA family
MAQIFTREATGLVRSISTTSLLIFSFSVFGYQFSFYFIANLAPIIGGNFGLALLIYMTSTVIFALLWYSFVGIMPRSGGDYVFLSRTLNPTIAFVGNLTYIIFLLLFVAVNASLLVSVGFTTLLGYLGVIYNSSSLLSTAASLSNPTTAFIVAFVLILLGGLVTIRSLKTYLRVQNIAFVIMIVGALAMLFALLFTSHSAFVSSFNSFASSFTGQSSNYYNNMTQTATTLGWTPPSTSSLFSTFLLFPVLGSVSFTYVTFVGGEVKNAKKATLIAILGSNAIIFGLIAATLFLLYNVAGFNFLSAINYLLFNSPGKIPLPALPYAGLLISIVANPIVGIIITSVTIVQLFIYMPAVFITASRSLFAYSFDKLAPSWFGKVSERTNSPTNAILASVAVALVLFVAISIPLSAPYIFLLTTVPAWWWSIFPGVLIGFAAILLPKLHPNFHSLSPIKGLKLQLIGLVGIAFMLLLVYLELTNAVFGANRPFAIELVIGIAVAVVAIYVVRRIQVGKTLDLVFKEIPPE